MEIGRLEQKLMHGNHVSTDGRRRQNHNIIRLQKFLQSCTEINACIYYSDSLTIVQNVSLIIAIAVSFVIQVRNQEKSKCEFLLMRLTYCRMICNNKNIAFISKFTVCATQDFAKLI